MYRRSFSALALFALASMSFAASSAWQCASAAVVQVIRVARTWAVSAIDKVVAAFAVSPASVLPPAVSLVAARAFVARFVKRERPQLQARWRMCPST